MSQQILFSPDLRVRRVQLAGLQAGHRGEPKERAPLLEPDRSEWLAFWGAGTRMVAHEETRLVNARKRQRDGPRKPAPDTRAPLIRLPGDS